jgi:hypothetical protein
MKVKIERSGGLAGLSSIKEKEEKDLPNSLADTARKLLDPARMPNITALKKTKGAADYFTYRITITNGQEHHVIDCNEFNMDGHIKSLVRYILNNSKN